MPHLLIYDTPQHIVKDVSTRLHQAGANVLGVVLNSVDLSGGDYYYYRDTYSYYYAEEDGTNGSSKHRAVG